jgi:hypothetical protein
MSGGSLDYVYHKIDSAIEEIRCRSKRPIHRAFCKHLEDVSKALYYLEMVLSGDCSSPEEEPYISAVLSEGAVIEQCLDEAKAAIKELTEVVSDTEKRLRGNTK